MARLARQAFATPYHIRIILIKFLQYLLAEHIALDHHARNMERTFEKVALGRLCHCAVAMQIAIPLAVFGIGEVGVCPLADALMAIQILLVACAEVGIERCDNGLALRSPELHVLRKVLHREVLTVTEVDDSTVLFVPTPVP